VDEGRTWTPPRAIKRSCPELFELSGPAIQLQCGTVLAVGSLFPMWDGTQPSGRGGVLLRSEDGGLTWDDQSRFFLDPQGAYSPSEPRLCEMQPGRVVCLAWMSDHEQGKNMTNHVVVSHDEGATWSQAMDTGVPGQASNLLHWKDDLLLTVHAQREGDEIGLFVLLVDFAHDQWKTVEKVKVWGNAPSMEVASFASMGSNLRFGQPSLLRMEGGEVLASHWAIEEGQGRILTHRLQVVV